MVVLVPHYTRGIAYYPRGVIYPHTGLNPNRQFSAYLTPQSTATACEMHDLEYNCACADGVKSAISQFKDCA